MSSDFLNPKSRNLGSGPGDVGDAGSVATTLPSAAAVVAANEWPGAPENDGTGVLATETVPFPPRNYELGVCCASLVP